MQFNLCVYVFVLMYYIAKTAVQIFNIMFGAGFILLTTLLQH